MMKLRLSLTVLKICSNKAGLKMHVMDHINCLSQNLKRLSSFIFLGFNLLKACSDYIHFILVRLCSKTNGLCAHTLTHVEFLCSNPQRGF